MGFRLSKIYTRTGDDGTTGLGDGSRIPKDAARVEAFGAIDELNSQIGVLLAHELQDDARACLVLVQHGLFDLGGALCIPGHRALVADDVAQLERTLDRLNADLPPLKEFILPGGSPSAAACHVARAVCRRAERRVVTLARHDDIDEYALPYLNRLSDLLFVLARVCARRQGGSEVLWRRRQVRGTNT